jgi:hypothetical protein
VSSAVDDAPDRLLANAEPGCHLGLGMLLAQVPDLAMPLQWNFGHR